MTILTRFLWNCYWTFIYVLGVELIREWKKSVHSSWIYSWKHGNFDLFGNISMWTRYKWQLLLYSFEIATEHWYGLGVDIIGKWKKNLFAIHDFIHENMVIFSHFILWTSYKWQLLVDSFDICMVWVRSWLHSKMKQNFCSSWFYSWKHG